MAPEERALLTGDLAKLSPDQRATLVASVCRSVGLNPLTQPLQYITLNGKLTLYARKDCTDQLRAIHNVSVSIDSKEQLGDLYIVTVSAFLPNGRRDSEIGAVATSGLRGDALANAMMKSITKAKRRATLSICGLGFLDELEVETMPSAQVWREQTNTNVSTGEITASPAPKQLTGRAAEMPDTSRVRYPQQEAAKADADGAKPATDKMYAVLIDLISQARSLGEPLNDPEAGMTIAQARALKAFLQEVIATARAQAPEAVEVG